MSTSSAPLISLVPLAVLAVVAWRALDPSLPQDSTSVVIPTPLASDTSPAMTVASVAAPPNRTMLSGYEPLDLDSVFVKPAGPKGLEFTAETSALCGRKVRISGWMVKHLHDDPRIFLLHSQPMALMMNEYGLADDLPPSAMHVILADRPGWAPVWTPRPLVVGGLLELGPRQERDGRISHLRLIADCVIDSETGSPVELFKPIGLQPERLKSRFLTVGMPASALSSNHSSTNPTK